MNSKKFRLSRIPALPKKTQYIWWACRLSLFIWGVWGMLHGYTSEFVQATFAIIFTHLWDCFQLFGEKSFIRKMPYYLQTMLNVFICLACVVGTTINTRTDFDGIDIPEHIFAGYLATTGAFMLSDIMQGEKRPIKVSVQALFAMGCGVMLLVGWEYYEYTMDRLYGFVMQHGQKPYAYGLTDTMVDLMLGSGGCLAAMFIEAFRKVGYIGEGKEERRRAYREERAEAKREKELQRMKENEA